jgi:two-component system response regulator AtoC
MARATSVNSSTRWKPTPARRAMPCRWWEDYLARVADCDASILLFGESGVGKELAARFIHARSARSGAAFIVINCAAVPENLFESELFGHERGAFSGGRGLKKGLFELADGGTLFLDEVAEISLGLQAKLLRVLETGEFRRVGGTHTLNADVRLVSATNRRLLDEADEKRFRLDLYYRLAGIDVKLPPLHERREDIPALATFLLRRLRGERRACRLDPTALAALHTHEFPGNVRELRNLLQRAVLTCRSGMIRASDLQLRSASPNARFTANSSAMAWVDPSRRSGSRRACAMKSKPCSCRAYSA